MSLSVWQRNIVTEAGDVIPDAEIEVFDAGSSSKPDLFSDPDGNSSITNPFNADSNGFARFYVSGGRYDIAVNGAVLWEDVALGTTQRRDTGSAPSEVPTNSDLGTASKADTGPAPSEVPTNDDANERGFAQQVNSVSDLRESTFPGSLQRLWLSGYYGVGTAGGGPLYRKGDGYTESDENGILWVDADGVGWEAGPGFVLAEDATLPVPSRFDTLQEAIDETSQLRVTQGATITVNIESGHTLTNGLHLRDGDFRHFRLTSEDEVVNASLQSGVDCCRLDNCQGPVWDIRVDQQGSGRHGIYLFRLSGMYVSGSSDDRKGVINAGDKGAYIRATGTLDGEHTIWDGSGGDGVHFERQSRGNVRSAMIRNAGERGLTSQQLCQINAQEIDVSGAGDYGCLAHSGSRIGAADLIANNTGNDAIRADHNSDVDARNIEAIGSGSYGVRASDLGRIVVNSGVVKDSSGDDLNVLRGGVITAGGTETTNSNGNGPALEDTNVESFNYWGQHGVITVDDTELVGEWQPTLEGTDVAGSHTYGNRRGQFVKNGPLVYFNFRMDVSSFDSSADGFLSITGWPFPIADPDAYINVDYVAGLSTQNPGAMSVHMQPSGGNFRLVEDRVLDGEWATGVYSIASVNDGFTIRVSGVYRTS